MQTSRENDTNATAARSVGRHNADVWITALGWFSIGLGVAQLLTPRTVSRVSGLGAGLGAHPNMIRACGARELASGVGILSGRKTSRWLWSRVAGDAIDLALIGTAARAGGVHRRRLAWVAAAVAGIAALDAVASMRSSRHARAGRIDSAAGDIHVQRSLTINRSPDECYRFWRDFENFPRFMQHLESVVALSDTRSHWVATGPAGTRVEWDAEIVADEPGRLLAWSSSEGADIDHAGIVRFEEAPGGRGTIVDVEMQYRPPAGTAGVVIAKLFGEEPEQQIADDLRHFKQLLETGEIPTTVGQPSGRRGIIGRLLHKGAQQ